MNWEKIFPYIRKSIGTAILVILFWSFTIFKYRSDSPQVKRNLISSIANFV